MLILKRAPRPAQVRHESLSNIHSMVRAAIAALALCLFFSPASAVDVRRTAAGPEAGRALSGPVGGIRLDAHGPPSFSTDLGNDSNGLLAAPRSGDFAPGEAASSAGAPFEVAAPEAVRAANEVPAAERSPIGQPPAKASASGPGQSDSPRAAQEQAAQADSDRAGEAGVAVGARMAAGGAAAASAEFDGSALRPERAVSAALAAESGPNGWGPFWFHPPAGLLAAQADSPGLRDFLLKKDEQRRLWGEEHMLAALPDFFSYADNLLQAAGLGAERAELEAIRNSGGDPVDVDRRLDEFLSGLVDRLQVLSRGLDPHFSSTPGTPPARAALREIRQMLGEGPAGWEPFWFAGPGSEPWVQAHKPGLEAFLFEKLRQQSRWGQTHMLGQLDDYFGYLDNLLAAAGWNAERARLAWIHRRPAEPAQRDRLLNEYLISLVGRLRSRMRALDPSLAGKSESIYMVLARAYARLEPGSGKTIFDALSDDELLRIKYQPLDQGELGRIKAMTPLQRERELTPVFDTVWLLDIFEIGLIHRWGVAGGSPYSIRGYSVKEEHGGDDAFRAFVARAHRLGLKVMTDYIPNHYSLDSYLLEAHPEAFLHIVPPQPIPGEATDKYRDRIMADAPKDHWGWPMHHLLEAENFPEGGGRVRKWILVQYPFEGGPEGGYKWSDMAQIDYSRAEAREWQVAQARRLFLPHARGGFDIDGVRRDMSYFEANGRYFPHWLKVMRWMRGRGQAQWVRDQLDAQIAGFEERSRAVHDAEILADMDAAIREIKPAAFIIDEVYAHQREVSRAGSDGLYNKTGLYEALLSRDPERIRGALRELTFSLWQVGAAALVNFAANHDVEEGNPVDKFAGHLYPVLVHTLLFQPTLFYAGTELMVGRDRMLIRDGSPSEDDGRPLQKMIPFDARAWIDWSSGDPARRAFLRRMLEAGARNRDLFREGLMEALDPEWGERSITAWAVGLPGSDAGPRRGLLAAANWSPSPGTAWARFRVGGSGLDALGVFSPRPDRSYVLRDWAHSSPDGGPVTYERGGAELSEGITIGLQGGDVHVIEIEEKPAGVPAPL